jgi:filamentous hemagglutinin
LDKHSGRPGGTFDKVSGGNAEKNSAANDFVKEVLTNPASVRRELSRGGVEYRLPNGQGVRYDSNGSFSGFVDPKK